jgi:preprotein translocase subunit SecG
MHYVIILIHLMIVVAMVGLVLIQKSEGGGLGMGGGGGGGFMSSRGTANVLTRATAILAALFFATSLFLSWYASLDRKPRSILDSTAPAAPSAPAVPGAGGGVLNQLGGGTPQQQPAAPPQAPAGPQVPRQ